MEAKSKESTTAIWGTPRIMLLKFHTLEQGLRILVRNRIFNVTIEGDYALVIRTAKRLQCGSGFGKVTTHWRLAQIIQRIRAYLATLVSIDFNLVRRSTNSVTDRLANEGAACDVDEMDDVWSMVQEGQLKEDHAQLAGKVCRGLLQGDDGGDKGKLIRWWPCWWQID